MDLDQNEALLHTPHVVSATIEAANEWSFMVSTLDCLSVAQAWWVESDFQTKLLILLLSCLMLNLILIRIAWKTYGDRLSEMLMKDSSGRDSYEDGTRIQTEDLHNTKFPHSEKMHRD